ncbi:Uncharacterised protein [Dermacoccus nishinomiyaensis]|nr:Uncharacterised protein [Dermacoccus nishinomiyaensis]
MQQQTHVLAATARCGRCCIVDQQVNEFAGSVHSTCSIKSRCSRNKGSFGHGNTLINDAGQLRLVHLFSNASQQSEKKSTSQ